MNLFHDLRKYTDIKSRTQIENFTTEALKYLLKYSLANKTSLAENIFYYFGIPVNRNEYEKVKISSQKIYNVEGKKLIPDLTIQSDTNTIYLIEVKVDSKFNKYVDSENEIEKKLYRRKH